MELYIQNLSVFYLLINTFFNSQQFPSLAQTENRLLIYIHNFFLTCVICVSSIRETATIIYNFYTLTSFYKNTIFTIKLIHYCGKTSDFKLPQKYIQPVKTTLLYIYSNIQFLCRITYYIDYINIWISISSHQSKEETKILFDKKFILWLSW